MLTKVVWAALPVLLWSWATGSAQAQLDQVFLAKGAPSRGTITEMSKEQVTLDMSGVGRPFQVNEIIRITYANEPTELTNARNAIFQKNWGQAKTELEKID